MIRDIYIAGLPGVTKESVVDLFKFHFPANKSGYVRRLRETDVQFDNYNGEPPRVGMLGFFTSEGELTFWTEEMSDMLETANEEGMIPHLSQ